MEATQQGVSFANILPIIIPITFVLIIVLGLAYIPANIARKKGYGFMGFYILGIFLFFVALIISLCLSDKKQQLDEMKQAIHSEKGAPSIADELKKYSELLEHKNTLSLSSDLIFKDYLSKIYTNLLQREEFFGHSNSIKVPRYSMELNYKDSLLFSIKNASFINNQIQPRNKVVDKGISLKSFLEYMDIQEFIGERIYKYLNKSKNNKLNKNDFCVEMNNLYYGDTKNLIEFTFFLADFNDDGFVYKSDMKLILAYIPSATEFSQKMKIKQINKIINLFFDEKIEKNEDCEEKEIKYEQYLKYVEEYINNENKDNKQINSEILNDFNYNAPFFYFISILSYLFKNCPFNAKNVDYFIYSKTKRKLQLYRNEKRYLSQKKLLSTSKKDLDYSYFNGYDNASTKLDSTIIRKNSVIKNKLVIDAALARIDKKDLFQKKKSSSQIKINNENKYSTLRVSQNKKPKTIKHDYIISKNIQKYNEKKLVQKNLFNKNNIKIKNNSSSNVDESMLSKNYSPLINTNLRQSPNINQQYNCPNLFNSSNSNETNGSTNNSSNHLIKINSKIKVPSIHESKEKEKMLALSVGCKLKDEKNDIEKPGEFVLCEYSSEEENNNNKKKKKNNSSDEDVSDETEAYEETESEEVSETYEEEQAEDVSETEESVEEISDDSEESAEEKEETPVSEPYRPSYAAGSVLYMNAKPSASETEASVSDAAASAETVGADVYETVTAAEDEEETLISAEDTSEDVTEEVSEAAVTEESESDEAASDSEEAEEETEEPEKKKGVFSRLFGKKKKDKNKNKDDEE